MALQEIPSKDLRNKLSDVLSRVGFGKERLIVSRNGRSVAALIPVEDLHLLLRLVERLEDKIDVAEARKILASRGPTKPWAKVKKDLGL